VSIFEDGAKAFEAFEKDVDCFDLIVTDMTMPKLTGFEFSRKVLKLRQNIPIILCTGYSEILSKKDVLNLGIQRYVQKPLANNELAVLIRDILDDN
jgi:two-component system, cell cycle sensor histidine kinase and response regulator CckA